MVVQGDIVLIELGNLKSSEYGKNRPAIVIQDNIYNNYFQTTIIALITGKVIPEYTSNVFLSKSESGLSKDSTILLNQIRTIDKSRIKKRIKTVTPTTLNKTNLALKRVLNLN